MSSTKIISINTRASSTFGTSNVAANTAASLKIGGGGTHNMLNSNKLPQQMAGNRGNGSSGGATTDSSSSSDPVESDFSENDDIDELYDDVMLPAAAATVTTAPNSKSTNNTTITANNHHNFNFNSNHNNNNNNNNSKNTNNNNNSNCKKLIIGSTATEIKPKSNAHNKQSSLDNTEAEQNEPNGDEEAEDNHHRRGVAKKHNHPHNNNKEEVAVVDEEEETTDDTNADDDDDGDDGDDGDDDDNDDEDNQQDDEDDNNDNDNDADDDEDTADEDTADSNDNNTDSKHDLQSSGDDEKEYELSDFQMIKTIGTGTFGRVCLCHDKAADEYCAMKILAMADVIRLKQVEHVKNEKSILSEINHPFIVNMRWHTKDDCCLYMLFDYVCGGELFSYLRNAGRFSSATANFYASEIILALEYLHSLSIVYRDLKPENLLLDRNGHLKITDFGFAKKLKDRTWTLCGTPEYLAPEIIQSKGHNRAVDFWAFGVLIYEMLVGFPPFYDDNPFGIYEKILSGKIEWPRQMDPIAKDLIKKLLIQDRTKRLGNMKNGADDIKRHRWFKQLDWDEVYNRKLKPPIMPRVHYEGDTSNFDEYPETDWKALRTLDKSELKLFEDF